MPYILKQKTLNSPGIITFTHNEALYGLPKNSKKVKEFLINSHEKGEWIYGTHVQGDLSSIDSFSLEEWQSFIMWPDKKAHFLKNVPEDKILDLNCINFMPVILAKYPFQEKMWDITIVSRASEIKRITPTLLLVKKLFEIRPHLKVNFIVPDLRQIKFGEKSYSIQRIDRNYFEWPKKIFTSLQLKNISFISSSQFSFGNFPLSEELMMDIVSKSKFLMLNSHSEGVPRVIAEAFLLGTPCIVSKNLKTPLSVYFNEKSVLPIEDDENFAAITINEALDNYRDYKIDREYFAKIFSESEHKELLKEWLIKKLQQLDHTVEGNWFFDDLHLNLACHGQKFFSQLTHNEKLFFDWFDRVSSLQKYDEDKLFDPTFTIDEEKTGFFKQFMNFFIKQ